MNNYGTAEYWDARYQKKDTNFDWYLTYTSLKELIIPYVEEHSRILVVGCGNSRLSAQMYDDGFQNITNIDISEVVIQQMKRRYADREKMEWIAMDCRKLDFPSESFDVIIDKGTIDSMLCGDKSFIQANIMIKEFFRVLKPGGKSLTVSYGVPDDRMDHLEQIPWKIEHKQIAKSLLDAAYNTPPEQCYHIYTAIKSDGKVPVDDSDDSDDDDARGDLQSIGQQSFHSSGYLGAPPPAEIHT